MLQVYSTNASIWRDFKALVSKKQSREACRANYYCHKEVFRLIPFPGSTQRKMSNVLNFEDFVAMVFVSVGSRTGIHLWTLGDVCNEVSVLDYKIQY